MADKRLRTMVFPGLEDTYTIPQDMNDLESIDAVAEPYDEFASYSIGDYCSNGGKLYICNTAILSGETWNANHWTETNVGDEILAEKAATNAALNGKVNKAGDTMSGNLTIHNSNPSLLTKSTIIDTTETSPASTYTENICMTDINDRYLVYLQGAMLSNGTIGLTLSPRRFLNGANVDNGISLSIRNDGSKTVSLGAPAAWLSALGLGTSGALPITVAQGGTGQTEVTSTSTLSQIATAASGFTFSSPNFSQWGKVVIFRVGITKNVAWSGDQTAGTVVSGKRTITQCALVCYTNPYVTGYLDPNGTITINSATTINANSTHYFYAIYLLA